MQTLIRHILSISSIVLLAACSSSMVNEADNLAPSYATLIGFQLGGDKYVVTCAQGDVYVDKRYLKASFYYEDGTQISFKEFCDSEDSSTRIKK